MANGNAAPRSMNPVLIVVGVFLWFLLCWVLPIVKLRNKDTSANMKTVWSGWLIIAGMGPIAWKAWDLYNTRGNAASNNTGGPAPPEPNVEPNLATTKIGSETGQQRVNGFPGGSAS